MLCKQPHKITELNKICCVHPINKLFSGARYTTPHPFTQWSKECCANYLTQMVRGVRYVVNITALSDTSKVSLVHVF